MAREHRGRPRAGEEPAPTVKRTVMVPEATDATLEALATLHGRTHHGEIRAALDFWIEMHRLKGVI